MSLCSKLKRKVIVYYLISLKISNEECHSSSFCIRDVQYRKVRAYFLLVREITLGIKQETYKRRGPT